MDYDIRKNAEGYWDPTACKAITKVDREKENNHDGDSERFFMLIKAIKNICELSDFALEERIILRDKRTGRIWR